MNLSQEIFSINLSGTIRWGYCVISNRVKHSYRQREAYILRSGLCSILHFLSVKLGIFLHASTNKCSTRLGRTSHCIVALSENMLYCIKVNEIVATYSYNYFLYLL
jgi:hypothetical protein